MSEKIRVSGRYDTGKTAVPDLVVSETSPIRCANRATMANTFAVQTSSQEMDASKAVIKKGGLCDSPRTGDGCVTEIDISIL